MAHTRGSGHGHSPKGERPDPTEAPPYGSPLGSQGNSLAETHVKITGAMFWESTGYALGAAEKFLRHGDILSGVRALAGYRDQAERWNNYPDYPVEAAR